MNFPADPKRSRSDSEMRTDSHRDIGRFQRQIERLQTRLRLAVIFGGNKSTPNSVIYQSTNSRPWKSYEAVAEDIARALKRVGFRHVELMPDDMTLSDRLRRAKTDMAWLNSGGVQGYNPAAHAAAMLEMFGVPYVGHDPLNATVLDNKHIFKREAIYAGIPTPPHCTWHMMHGDFRPEHNTHFQQAFGKYCGPFIVKPVSGRASLHVHVVSDRAMLPRMVADVGRATDNLVLIERYLPGREFCIAVTGPIVARNRRLERHPDSFAFAALERILGKDEQIFTSMDERPITQDRFRSVSPTDSNYLQRMHRLACDVFHEFNLSSLIRLDLRADENDNLLVLEANPKPDLKQPAGGVTSLISAGLAESGMDYDDLILSLLADRLEFLLARRCESVRHIVDLIHSPRAIALGLAYGQAIARRSRGRDDVVGRINDMAADLNVRKLSIIMSHTEGDNTAGKTTEPNEDVGVTASNRK